MFAVCFCRQSCRGYMDSDNAKLPFLAPKVARSRQLNAELAALKCVLTAYGIAVQEEQLLATSQTDEKQSPVASIIQLARQWGLAVEQMNIPADHLLLPAAANLPALVAVRSPDEQPRIIVIWNRIGPLLQVMDPNQGRRWLTEQSLLNEL